MSDPINKVDPRAPVDELRDQAKEMPSKTATSAGAVPVQSESGKTVASMPSVVHQEVKGAQQIQQILNIAKPCMLCRTFRWPKKADDIAEREAYVARARADGIMGPKVMPAIFGKCVDEKVRMWVPYCGYSCEHWACKSQNAFRAFIDKMRNLLIARGAKIPN